MAPIQWFSARDNRRQGPFSPAELKQRAERGQLAPDDLVWREGMEQWTAARKVKGLFSEAALARAEAAAAPHAPPGAPADTPASDFPPEQPAAPPVLFPPEAASGGQEASTGMFEAISESPAPLPAGVAAAAPSAAMLPAAAPAAAPTRPAPAAFEPSPQAFARAREGDTSHLFDFVLDAARRHFTAAFLEASAKLFGRVGHVALCAAMVLLAVWDVRVGLAQSRPAQLVHALCWILVWAALQYAAARLFAAAEQLHRWPGLRMHSTAPLDALALLGFLGGVALLVAHTIRAVQSEQLALLAPAVAMFLFCQYAAVVALNPESVGLSLAPGTAAAQQALGVAALLLKLPARLAPVLYGLGIVGGTVELAVALLTAPNEAELPPADALGSLALVPGPAMVTLLAYAAFPIAAYLLGLAACLGLELLRTLLGIPAILEKLSPRDAEGGERD